MKFPAYLTDKIELPDFYRITQHKTEKGLRCISESVTISLDQILPSSNIKKGESVALLVGSRGISNLSEIVTAVCQKLKQIGALPVIVPAMGSHGGAVADGQRKVLETLGISEDVCGVPVRSSMDVVTAGSVLDNLPVWFSKDAAESDHTICINRIRPHTKFKGSVESGLYKMLCIGAGKHLGAEACHQAALRHGFSPVIKAAGDLILERMNVRFGIAVIEDAGGETMKIDTIPAGDLYLRESELLDIAKAEFPKLPVKKLDALIIQKIGKDVSGSGMDPNVTGRAYDLMEDDFSGNLDVTRVAILDLTEKTDGNGIGLGNADIITEKLFQKLDYEKTLTNALTSLSLRKAFIPVRLPDDRMAIRASLTTSGLPDILAARAVIIENTKKLDRFFASEALLDELAADPNLSIQEKVALSFDAAGNLVIDD